MDYFELLGLSREPFSNSPDPSFFFESKNHTACLRELATALNSGEKICFCLGDVGSGKSTICRALIQSLNAEEACESHLILDPTFAGGGDFLAFLYTRIAGTAAPAGSTNESLTRKLVERVAKSNQARIVLAVDEGQKLPRSCLNLLVQLLETDSSHRNCLQAVIFAQEEFLAVLEQIPSLRKTAGTTCRLTSLGFLETRSLIQHRLRLAGAKREIFTWPAYWAVQRATGGRPRKIMHLGHQVLMSLIASNRSRATRSTVLAASAELEGRQPLTSGAGRNALAVGLFCAMVLFSVKLNITGPTEVTHGTVDRFEPHEHRGLISTTPHLTMEINPASPPISADTQPPATLPAAQNVAPPSNGSPGLAMDTKIVPDPAYYVQLGAYQVRRYAEQSLAHVSEAFQAAGLILVEYRGLLWFIVYLDSFESPDQALEMARQVRRELNREAVVVEMAKGRYNVVQE